MPPRDLKTIKPNQVHGGARAGSGRKKGASTQKTREIADKAASEGTTPLEFMLEVMRDTEADKAARMDMAKAAAPYIHPRLSTVDANLKGDGGFVVQIVRFTDDD
jgi:hypothetical protein